MQRSLLRAPASTPKPLAQPDAPTSPVSPARSALRYAASRSGASTVSTTSGFSASTQRVICSIRSKSRGRWGRTSAIPFTANSRSGKRLLQADAFQPLAPDPQKLEIRPLLLHGCNNRMRQHIARRLPREHGHFHAARPMIVSPRLPPAARLLEIQREGFLRFKDQRLHAMSCAACVTVSSPQRGISTRKSCCGFGGFEQSSRAVWCVARARQQIVGARRCFFQPKALAALDHALPQILAPQSTRPRQTRCTGPSVGPPPSAHPLGVRKDGTGLPRPQLSSLCPRNRRYKASSRLPIASSPEPAAATHWPPASRSRNRPRSTRQPAPASSHPLLHASTDGIQGAQGLGPVCQIEDMVELTCSASRVGSALHQPRVRSSPVYSNGPVNPRPRFACVMKRKTSSAGP